MRQILRKDRSRSWSVPRIEQLRLAWSPPEWVVSDLMLPNRRAPPPPHGISKRTMCRPTRLQFRGRLIRLGEMSEDDAQSLHRGTGGSTYTRKASATREVPKRGEGWPDDELKVFATLRGPFFAIGDEALLDFRQQ